MRFRLTIERLRTLVLVAGVLLVAALVGFLAVAKWRNPLNRKDLPNKLGLNIQQEANGWTYTHERRGHTLYKIHASRLEQLTAGKGGRVLLHDVRIELYGEDGSRLDRIEGKEFEYDQKQGLASAPGAVEIIVTRPGTPLAIAPDRTGEQALRDKQQGTALAAAAKAAEAGEIHVKTSGLVFEQKSGLATTRERVEFALAQGRGSAQGATYEAGAGKLILERAVDFQTKRGEVELTLRAEHAEFERDDRICQLRGAALEQPNGRATAGEALLHFRDDGSAERLDATHGFAVQTASGSHITAPAGFLDFDAHNQPRRGSLTGGVALDSLSARSGRQVHGTAPQADLLFTVKGVLQTAHLERGVELRSDEGASHAQARVWHSPVADLDFREAGQGRVDLAAIRGSGGVQLTSEGAPGTQPARLSADELRGDFLPDGQLRSMTGTGHAQLEQNSASGARQRTSGDRIEARFAQSGAQKHASGIDQIESALVEGNVVLLQDGQPRPGQQPSTLRATAGRAQFEGAGQWLHLSLSPRVADSGMEVSARRIDFSQDSGEARAIGNVKATWTDTRAAAKGQGGPALGGHGPMHVVANEAQLRREGASNADRLTFTGKARIWQESNSIEAPEIVLDRARMLLTATAATAADPVRAVFLSASPADSAQKNAARPPSLIRLRGGELSYSDSERRALVRAGNAGPVTAETTIATTTSNEMELQLTAQSQSAAGAQAQVEHMVARGHVTIAAQSRRGTGERLEYSGLTGEYTLTGTPAAPPRVVDPARGSVTGESLVFRGRDDTVTVLGGAQKARTLTTAPR